MNHSNRDALQRYDTHPARDAERSQLSLDCERPGLAGKAEAPIGVFDSGPGGLTILSVFRQELPYENYIYFVDTAHCPYATRSAVEITDQSVQGCHYLVARDAE